MRFALPLVVAVLTLTACATNGIYHVVGPGQTLYRIAKTYEVDEASLAKVNRIDHPTSLKAGQRLLSPGATQTRTVSVDPPKAPPAPVVPPPTVKPPKKKSAPVARQSKPPAAKSTPIGQSEEIPGPRPAPGTFVWPVKGKIITEFGATEGKSSKGIEIAVAQGTQVVAAAAGKVIYSGSGIRGYGNLIILEHADNYFTVYGFNTKNLVAVNNFVGQGDKIALSGAPSGGKSPRLHFEIRKGKVAANPIFFLP